jgi:TonB-dependent receptor
MHRFFWRISIFVTALLIATTSVAQTERGVVTGRVVDSGGAVLRGARVEIQPLGIVVISNNQGEFTVTNLALGNYEISVSYVGFELYSTTAVVNPGLVTRVDAVMKVASKNEEIVVTAERAHGEAEAINETRSADNILQVLPAEVITSLPNANIADAVGRLPSVTIERDEGEGKYVQVRGTEPRLTNTTVDGITIPSPESSVRQIKLDTIASDLVEAVEINKTLQANQDADGIGGSVNLKTKTAEDTPTLTLYGLGGYTPIIGGRGVDQFGGTVGKRFGAQKKLGVLFGATYDWNGRGINDIEPSPTIYAVADNPPTTKGGLPVPHYDSIDLRDYVYYRTRWGLAGSTDYKLSDGSGIYLRGLYSTFRNWGNKWVYTLNDGDLPQYSQDWRRPDYAVGSLVAGGHHQFKTSWLSWDTAVSRSRDLGGSGGASYKWVGDPNIDCTNDQSLAASVYRPGWSAGCFGSGADNALDRNNYGLSKFQLPTSGHTAQLNLTASASYARQYHVGTHYGTFEFGGKIRNEHKFDDTYDSTWRSINLIPVSQHPEWAGGFTDSSYYDKTYKFGNVTDWEKVKTFVLNNPGLFTFSGGPGVNPNNYDLVERISAGYLMNTIDLTSRIHLVTGVRFEATHLNTLSFNSTTNKLDFPNGGDYLDVLPSAALRIALDKESGIRLVYSRALSRPDPQDITSAVSQLSVGINPNTISEGNANLKAEHANNYDILYERYLKPIGLLQAGYFYKDLSDPIVQGSSLQPASAWAQFNPDSQQVRVFQPINAGSAYIQGIEVAFQQHFTYMPNVLHFLGISANYSYTASQARNLPGRTDSPRLLRQAPNTWNVSPTFDTRRFSMRLGMTYNDAMIYSYQFDPTALTAGGVKGPGGDAYLYSHFQIDTEASYKLTSRLSVYGYGLNLNNEVFGFYQGSPQYMIQREYYHPTFAGGLRYTLGTEK